MIGRKMCHFSNTEYGYPWKHAAYEFPDWRTSFLFCFFTFSSPFLRSSCSISHLKKKQFGKKPATGTGASGEEPLVWTRTSYSRYSLRSSHLTNAVNTLPLPLVSLTNQVVILLSKCCHIGPFSSPLLFSIFIWPLRIPTIRFPVASFLARLHNIIGLAKLPQQQQQQQK